MGPRCCCATEKNKVQAPSKDMPTQGNEKVAALSQKEKQRIQKDLALGQLELGKSRNTQVALVKFNSQYLTQPCKVTGAINVLTCEDDKREAESLVITHRIINEAQAERDKSES